MPATVAFFVADAPHPRLVPGAHFDLHEGLFKVAHFDVVE
jgi:hypothetical protein